MWRFESRFDALNPRQRSHRHTEVSGSTRQIVVNATIALTSRCDPVLSRKSASGAIYGAAAQDDELELQRVSLEPLFESVFEFPK